MRRARVIVSGHVQGVWFRDSCRDVARRAGVTGWIRNRPDGTVEAAFEGAADTVAALVSWCAEGPPGARVDHTEVIDEPPEGEVTFRVRYDR